MKYENILLMGDINVDMFDHSNSHYHMKMLVSFVTSSASRI